MSPPHGQERPVLFAGIDRAAFSMSLAVRLREAGLPVGFTGMTALARGMDFVPPSSTSSLYWVARVCLVQRQSDLALFDSVFAAVFADRSPAVDRHVRRRQPATRQEDEESVPTTALTASSGEEEARGLPWATLPRVSSAHEAAPTSSAVPERLPSELEGLADTPFDQFDEAGLELLSRWLTSALDDWPTRRSRRHARHRAGRRTALRPTLARARRTGWEPIQLVRTRAVLRRRRVVMLCDVSQSMEGYAAAYFHLMRAVALTADAEVFAFATTLTRLTSVLACRSATEAIQQATEKVTDRFGGTRIASNVRALLNSRHSGATRGAIVIIASDGWDSDAPDQLAKAMARLHRRAHQVLWLNPRAAAPGFAPLVGAMAAALPYCDHLLPAHSVRALADVVDAIVGGGAGNVVSSRA